MPIKRIAIFSSYFPPHMGGVEQFSYSLATALLRRKLEVAVVCCNVDGGETHEIVGEGIEVFRLPAVDALGRLPIPLGNTQSKKLWSQIGGFKPDAIVVNNRFYQLSLEALAFARRLCVPALLVEHGSGYLTVGNPLVDAALHAYEHAFSARVRAYGMPGYGVSRKAASWLRTFGIEPAGTICNSIDVPAFNALASTRDFKGEFSLDPDAPTAAFTGRLIPEKGTQTMLELANALPAATFFVAGEGPEFQRLQEAAPPNLHMLGRLDRGDVAALLQQADVFYFPSLYPEGLPTSLLEAAAAECFIVTTNVGGAEELVANPYFGTIVYSRQPSEFIAAAQAAFSDLETSKQRALACRQHVEHNLGWDAAAAAVIDAFA